MASELQPIKQLKDVYEIAQLVGEQFQSLMERFGNSHFVELVNTVVNSLEHLETCFQDNQKLQARTCKLLLDNDSLLKENEQLKERSKKNDETLASIEVLKMDRMKLMLQVEGLKKTNRELHQQIEETDNNYEKMDDLQNSDQEGESITGETQEPAGSRIDEMEIPRMKRRLLQADNELKRTRSKLLSSQSTLKCIVAENNSLKAQLEDSKAEISLQTLRLTQSGANFPPEDSPKFYKEDLLIVLRERNELKEELDALRDELNMTRLQLRYHHHQSTEAEIGETNLGDSDLHRIRAGTKVRDIVTSITADPIRIEKSKKGTKTTNLI